MMFSSVYLAEYRWLMGASARVRHSCPTKPLATRHHVRKYSWYVDALAITNSPGDETKTYIFSEDGSSSRVVASKSLFPSCRSTLQLQYECWAWPMGQRWPCDQGKPHLHALHRGFYNQFASGNNTSRSFLPRLCFCLAWQGGTLWLTLRMLPTKTHWSTPSKQ